MPRMLYLFMKALVHFSTPVLKWRYVIPAWLNALLTQHHPCTFALVSGESGSVAEAVKSSFLALYAPSLSLPNKWLVSLNSNYCVFFLPQTLNIVSLNLA